jgi:hypothetical protein
VFELPAGIISCTGAADQVILGATVPTNPTPMAASGWELAGMMLDARKREGKWAKQLDNVATRWLKNTKPGDAQAFTRDMDHAHASAAGALLIGPGTTFRVTGENVVLSLLVGMFGPRVVIELLDEHAIEFVLCQETDRGSRRLYCVEAFTDTGCTTVYA